MLTILSSNAILDLPTFTSLKEALVFLFREPKDLSTLLLSPNAPRQCSIPSSRKAHEYRGPPPRRTPVCSCGPRAPGSGRGERQWSSWTNGPPGITPLSRGAPRYPRLSRPRRGPPGRSPSPRPRSSPPRRASSPSAVWSTRPNRARAPSRAPTSGRVFFRSDPPIASTIPQDDRPAM